MKKIPKFSLKFLILVTSKKILRNENEGILSFSESSHFDWLLSAKIISKVSTPA